MKLLAKFNLILVVLFGAGSILIAYTAYQFLMRNARSQVIQQAELMIESAGSTRQYTANELAPLLETLPAHTTRFLPETIPFYAATVTFDYLRKKYPEYSYKEAALNPTNLRDRAVEWEADLINYFRNHSAAKELVGERDTPTGRMLYIAHPITTEQACLECHSLPAQAPPAIVRTYGSVNGFGWKPNETVAAQIVSVPMSATHPDRGPGFPYPGDLPDRRFCRLHRGHRRSHASAGDPSGAQAVGDGRSHQHRRHEPARAARARPR